MRQYGLPVEKIDALTQCPAFTTTFIFPVPARVESSPEAAYLTLQEGEDALLECKVSGNPKPEVSWKKQVKTCIFFYTL